MSTKRFKRLQQHEITHPLDDSKTIIACRWQALVDMPEHNRRKGAVTGYIDAQLFPENNEKLWVGINAVVCGAVETNDVVRVQDYAIVNGPKHSSKFKLYINNNVIIMGAAVVGFDPDHTSVTEDSIIDGPSIISSLVKWNKTDSK